MKAFIGVTDWDWFSYLASAADVDEVNFWQPGGNRVFQALSPGELFLFKLHSPRNFIVGGGIFAYACLLPISVAWQSFGFKNGTNSLEEMRERTTRYRRTSGRPRSDYNIGCIFLEQPFFLPEASWIPVPSDWSPNIVQGKSYDLRVGVGLALWNELAARPAAGVTPTVVGEQVSEVRERYGEPMLVRPRLGQGTFRALVTDVYARRCAVTGERTLPVLQAAHIQPYSVGGPHEPGNGILLRSDLHTLLDQGYITIAKDLRLEVSGQIREEFENGRDYYALHGKQLQTPSRFEFRPAQQYIDWHATNVFRG